MGIFIIRHPNTLLNLLNEQQEQQKQQGQQGQQEALAEAPREALQDAGLNASKFNIPRKDVIPRLRLPSCRFKIYRGLLRIRII